MKKTIFAILLAIMATVLVLSGCSKPQENDNEEVESPAIKESTASTPSVKETSVSVFDNAFCNITSYGEFSEGLAWVDFEQYSHKYSGIINTDGELLYYFEDSVSNKTPFSNGYSYFTKDDHVYMIDKNGAVVATYSTAPNAIVLGMEQLNQVAGARVWGDGYVLTQEYTSGFDEAKYTYRILDAAGKELTNFTSEGTSPILDLYYLGEGTFAVQTTSGVASLYFAKSNTWQNNMVSYSYLNNITYQDDILVFFCGNYDFDYFFTYTDPDGNVKDVMIPEEYGKKPSVIGISNGVILLENERDFYYTYNTKTSSFSKYTGKYADRLYWENAVNLAQCYGFEDDTIAISLEGQDENEYIMLLTSKFEEKCEPFKGRFFYIADGVLVVTDNGCSIYDLNGNYLSSFGDSSQLKLNEGTLTTKNGYFKYDGSPLFSSVDFSGGKCVELK